MRSTRLAEDQPRVSAARMTTFRWLMILPGGYLAWYLVFIIGLTTYPIVESALCPSSDMISGTCMNPRVNRAMVGYFHVFVGIAAAVVVLTAAVIAPSRRRAVAWVAFVVGGLVSTLLAVLMDSVSEAVVAVVVGLATAYLCARRSSPESGEADKDVLTQGGLRTKS